MNFNESLKECMQPVYYFNLHLSGFDFFNFEFELIYATQSKNVISNSYFNKELHY